MKILIEKLKNRSDSFWYDGIIAIISKEEGDYSLYATGEIRAVFNFNGESFRDSQAVEEALNRGLKDSDLNNVSFGNNNWFEVVLTKNGKLIDCTDLDVCYDYDEGIEMLKAYAKTRYYKQTKV